MNAAPPPGPPPGAARAGRGALNWSREGPHWPHHDRSSFLEAAGLRWHVQRFASTATPANPPAPRALLLHGTGASTHSWRGLAPLLCARFEVLCVDLPGHAFTGTPDDTRLFSMSGMAAAVGALLAALQAAPALVVGHSAGAALALRMALDGLLAPRLIVGINAALLPLGGPAAPLFAPMARLLAGLPVVPRLFAWRAGDPAVTRRLLAATGSRLDAQGVALYGRLVRHPAHAAGALAMMAHWDLPTLARDLPRLATPVHLVTGRNDRTVAPRQALQAQALLPAPARVGVTALPGLGHLAHEEDPAAVAAALWSAWNGCQP